MYEKKWCQNMRCWQHHSRQNLVKNWLWFNKKIKWESLIQIWNKNDSWHQKHDNLHWMICYENDCNTHLSEKKKEYFLKASKNYQEKKKTRWATWNTERTKISHQIDKFSEKFNDKSRFLKTEQKKKQMKQTKATLFWWEQKIIYNSELIAQQLALTKNSEKHHKSEKLKKKSAQKKLSSNASEISINQQI